MINNKNFDPNLLSIDKTSFKGIDAVTYHSKYITMKSLDHVHIDSKNYFYLIFNNEDGYIIEESNEDKHFIFASTDQKKRSIRKVHKTLE